MRTRLVEIIIYNHFNNDKLSKVSMHKLNPIWLRTLITLVETGHFTKTAEKLNMTQPGVTQHIHKLEEACGYSLINRTNREFDLTEQGRQVYQHALNLAEDERRLFEQLEFDNPYAGRCALACSGAMALNIYPKLLDLQQRHKGLNINLKAAPNQQILSEIKAGQIDLSIVTDIPNKHWFEVTEIGIEELCLVIPKGLDEHDDLAGQLSTLGLIDHPDAEQYLAMYFAKNDTLSCLRISRNDIPATGFINQINQILSPVAKGIGFTVIPRSAVVSFAERDRVQIVAAEQPVTETLFLVSKKGRELPKRFDAIKQVILSAVKA